MMTTYHIAGFVLFLVTIGLILFHLRDKWVHRLTDWWNRRSIRLDGYSALASFRRDIEAGLNSEYFNIARDNANDSRKGLDEAAREEIIKIMSDNGISFDEARLQYTKSQFAENRIGPDGTPLDPRTITFDTLRGNST